MHVPLSKLTGATGINKSLIYQFCIFFLAGCTQVCPATLSIREKCITNSYGASGALVREKWWLHQKCNKI
jgi:hypothetical protein